jgi:hypothetical protein
MHSKLREFFRVYVIECKTPGHFYVGATSRLPYIREREHKEKWGSKWTTLHGFKRTVFTRIVPQICCAELENMLTVHLQGRYGYRFVRGGNYTATCEKQLKRWLHPTFKLLGPTDVLPLHSRPMGKFPSELRRLVDAFEMVCGLEDSDHLDSDVFS